MSNEFVRSFQSYPTLALNTRRSFSPKNFPRFFVRKSRGKELVRKVRQLAIVSKNRRGDKAQHVRAHADMVDADQIGHSLDAFGHPLQIPEGPGTWPDANHTARIGDGASVLGINQRASTTTSCSASA